MRASTFCQEFMLPSLFFAVWCPTSWEFPTWSSECGSTPTRCRKMTSIDTPFLRLRDLTHYGYPCTWNTQKCGCRAFFDQQLQIFLSNLRAIHHFSPLGSWKAIGFRPVSGRLLSPGLSRNGIWKYPPMTWLLLKAMTCHDIVIGCCWFVMVCCRTYISLSSEHFLRKLQADFDRS